MAHKSIEEIIDICKRQGLLFEAAREFTLPASSESKSLFVTGSKPAILISRQISFDGDGVDCYSYRDPEVSNLGAPETTIRNPSDINPKNPTVNLYASATIESDGIETRKFVPLMTGTGILQPNGSGIQTIETEHSILPNKQINHVISNRSDSAQQVYASLTWIEPDRIPGLVINENGEFVSYTGEELLY